jgi:O-antigen/teichoic acid export membrane protein
MKKLIKISNLILGYGISQIIVVLLPVILLPILTRTLTISEFADYSIYKVILGLSTPFIAFALSTYLLKNFYDRLKNSAVNFIFNTSVFSFLSTLVLILISLIFKDSLQKILQFQDYTVFLYALINSFLFAIHTLMLTLYRAKSNVGHFFISNLVVFIITTGGVLFLSNSSFINLKLVLSIHMLAYIFSIFTGIIFFIKLRKKDFTFNLTLIKKAIQFSVPLVLYSIFTQIYGAADKLIINSQLTEIDLASYAAIFQLSFGISALGKVLQLTFSPYLFKKMSLNKIIDKEIIIAIISITLGMIVFSLLYYYCFPLLINIFLPNEYSINTHIAKWFIIAGFLQTLYWTSSPFLIIYEQRYYLLYIAVVAAILNVFLNLIYTKNGVEFAAIVYCLTWIVQLLGTWISIYYAKKNFLSSETN